MINVLANDSRKKGDIRTQRCFLLPTKIFACHNLHSWKGLSGTSAWGYISYSIWWFPKSWERKTQIIHHNLKPIWNRIWILSTTIPVTFQVILIQNRTSLKITSFICLDLSNLKSHTFIQHYLTDPKIYFALKASADLQDL